MAVRIRLKRVGKIHAAQYRVVVVDSRKKRDGRVIEEVGYYDPQPNPSIIRIDSERAQYWLGVGAQPSDQVRKLLVLTGDIAKFNGKADAVSRVIVSEADKAAQAEQARAFLLELLVSGIVDHPEDVEVTPRSMRRGQLLEVRVNPEDLGRVIGRGGRTARALRTVMGALSTRGTVRVDVVDTDRE